MIVFWIMLGVGAALTLWGGACLWTGRAPFGRNHEVHRRGAGFISALLYWYMTVMLLTLGVGAVVATVWGLLTGQLPDGQSTP